MGILFSSNEPDLVFLLLVNDTYTYIYIDTHNVLFVLVGFSRSNLCVCILCEQISLGQNNEDNSNEKRD